MIKNNSSTGINKRWVTEGNGWLWLIVFIPLFGCEAPLFLEGVAAQQREATHRSDMFQAAAASDEVIVVVGTMGAVLTSRDGGETWLREVLPDKPFLIDVARCPDGTFAILDVSRKLWLGDGLPGQWQAVAIDTQEALQAMTCDAAGTFWVVGGFSTILSSKDRGVSWRTTSLDEDLHFTGIQILDGQHAFVSGEFGAMAHSQDGGESWQPLTPLADDFYPQDALFISPQEGWVVGLSGTILHTRDGGGSWQRQATGTEVPLYGIALNAGVLHVVGGNGTLLRKQLEPGSGWQPVDHGQPIRFYLRAVTPLAGGKVLIGGGYGALHIVST
ncbi:MAG: YCF48-related protein [Candidatus Thiodiazotropha sp.]